MHPLHRFLTQQTKERNQDLNPVEVDQLIHLAWKQFGYDFSGYARASFERRLMGFMESRGLDSFSALLQGLRLGQIIWRDFLNELTVNVTDLFRAPETFQALRTHVLPYLTSFPKLNIWIAGCSTGEEVYSCAILLEEAGLLERSVLYGTDINPMVLEQAKAGILERSNWFRYLSNYHLAGGQGSLDAYFLINEYQIRLRPFLLKQMVFLPHNLATDQSFNQFHLIFYRNVCIYFDSTLQNKVGHLLDQSLVSLGFLVMGQHESLPPHWDQKIPLFDQQSNTYQKYPLQWKK
ncbi:MAG: protein-glutamate O-methyltransferase CheR [Bacteroidota bacterium]